MTLPTRATFTAEPSIVEAASVKVATTLARDLKLIGGKRLLLAQLDWDRFNRSAEPPGAPTPEVAKGSLTRDSRRRWELARISLRSGGRFGAFGLAKAIMERKADG